MHPRWRSLPLRLMDAYWRTPCQLRQSLQQAFQHPSTERPSLSLGLVSFLLPYLLPSHLLAVFAPTSDLPFIVAISRKRRESLKRARLSPRRPIANFVTVIILTDGSTLDAFNYLYTDKHWIRYNVRLLSIIPCILYSIYNIFFRKKNFIFNLEILKSLKFNYQNI